MFRTLITTDELETRLGQPDLVICDVRHDLARAEDWGRQQYEAGHIPGAVFVHLDRDLSAAKTGTNGRHPLPTPEAAAATFGRLGIAHGKQVVAYDQGGGAFAARLWWMLHWLGFDAVRRARRRLCEVVRRRPRGEHRRGQARRPPNSRSSA